MLENSVRYSDQTFKNVSSLDHTSPVYYIPCSAVLFTLCSGHLTADHSFLTYIKKSYIFIIYASCRDAYYFQHTLQR